LGPEKKRCDKGNSRLNHSFHINYDIITTIIIIIITLSRTWPRGLFLSQYPEFSATGVRGFLFLLVDIQ
jgi:hypothetical protein